MKRILVIVFSALIMVSLPACTGKKKLAEKEAREKKEKIEQVKQQLANLLSDNTLSLEEKEKQLAEIKALNLDDKEVQELIVKVEDKLREERRQKELREEEERKRKELEQQQAGQKDQVLQQLATYMGKIARAGSVNEADGYIASALQLFDSEQAPVLVIISKSGDIKDYDKPTTIRRYLEFVKDQKRYTSKVESVKINANGKITELELLK